MVVELANLNLPRKLKGRGVLNLDGQVAAVVESTELARCNRSAFLSSGLGFLRSSLLLSLGQ